MPKKEQVLHITHMGLGTKVVEVREAAGGGVKTTVFKDIVLLGPESSNPDSAINGVPLRYTPEFMKSAAPFYDGTRVYLNHCESWDDRSNRDLQRMMGVAENAHEDGGKLRADLVMVVTNQTEHAIGLMTAFPDKVSMSHDATCMVLEEAAEAVELIALRSVDIVPMGGTTKNLYESSGYPGRKVPPKSEIMDTKELETKVATLTKSLTESEGKVGTLETENATLKAEKMIETHLAESALPEASRSKMRKLLQGRPEEFVKDAIKTEKEHLESLGNPVVGAGVDGAGGAGVIETQESAGKVTTLEASNTALENFLGIKSEAK